MQAFPVTLSQAQEWLVAVQHTHIHTKGTYAHKQ